MKFLICFDFLVALVSLFLIGKVAQYISEALGGFCVFFNTPISKGLKSFGVLGNLGQNLHGL